MEKVKYIILLLIIIGVGIWLGDNLKNLSKKVFHSEISFEYTSHYFDTLYHQSEAEYYFIYKNIGNRELKINKIQSGCGCTIPEWNKESLKPNSKDSIRVVYDINNKGFFLKEILVFSNSISSPHHLEISGYVPFSDNLEKN